MLHTLQALLQLCNWIHTPGIVDNYVEPPVRPLSSSDVASWAAIDASIYQQRSGARLPLSKGNGMKAPMIG